MNGTTYKRKLASGGVRWAYSIYAGKDRNGKPIRIFKGGFKTQGEADDEKNRELVKLQAGQAVKPSPETLEDFMAEWFEQHAARRCTPKTVERYRQLAAYFMATLGKVKLSKLTPIAIQREMNRLHDAGGRERKTKKARPLSAKTVHHIHGVLNTALNSAVRLSLIPRNPATGCELPSVEKREAVALDPTQTDWFLDAARGHWVYPILKLAAATGCRRGELLALRWSDVNTRSRVITVSKSLEQSGSGLRIKSPKNGKPRAVPVPPSVLEVLAMHRQQQDAYREKIGKYYRADLDLVFATVEGEYLKPDTVTAAACQIAGKAGLKNVGLHTLRHSHGSQLLSAGVPLATVSKRLGHSSVDITARVYAHSFTQDELAAAEKWDALMESARSEREHGGKSSAGAECSVV